MVRVALLAFVPTLLASVVLGAPVSKRQTAFPVQDYASFQISDGQTGTAKAEAAAIFVDPFANVDLATLDDSVATNMETMRKAAEAAETDQFNPAIEAAGKSTAEGTALQNGKIKNKVLKLTAETQVLKIKLAKAKASGKDTASIESKIAAEQKKLDTNIATDEKNAGQTSKGVTGGSASTGSTSTDTTATDSTSTSTSTSEASTKTTATTAGTNEAATTSSFTLQDYADFQISDGTAGDAEAKANAVFVDPFANVDLATLDDQVAKDMETMRKAAEAAETDKFNPAIDAAGKSSTEGTALQNGKIKNKVLKLTGETQVLKIKLAKAKAAGDDTASIESKIAAEQKKLDTNIATDKKNAGQASKGVA